MSGLTALRERIVPLAIKARVQALSDASAEVRALRLTLGEPRIYEWAQSIGACTDPELAALVPPIPPAELRRMVAEPEAEIFLWTGILDLNLVLSAWESHGSEVAGEKPAILDFGCGCGRLLRFLVPSGDVAEVHGADVNPDLVAWCNANLPGIRTIATPAVPPLPYQAETFDLVYSLSVLTHLAEEMLQPWLSELARVQKPGGLLVATLHPTALTETRIRALAAAAGLEVLAVIPGGMRGWQDVLIARKRR